jgi:DNA-binding NarL/FixJ family response regulator
VKPCKIASRLGISEKTVRNHLSSVFLKLQVNDRTAAALKARNAGLGMELKEYSDRRISAT